ncbi:molybdate ABC transporter substrate-binding protein [Corynebacterium hylobatis]|uniref:Molybdate ABC transporter substrate-binding protein n=1 Tax=Corynebacterium hylobatis TaxID=1859290 RepID=A0A430I220_9CORY|nr:molybdate ABC transporter substrate-binding protein [Corynebacterium hylobatis]RSZ66185.1 molybdate ABC transporter substrate-binding protein [Corynebacterium hylobatis]
MRLSRAVGLLAPAAAGLLLVSCATDSDSQAGTDSLTILGASSTRVLNDDFQTLTDAELDFVNAGSSTLVQQLADGSPGDVLITADRANMDKAVEQGLVEDPRAVAVNTLVMVVPAGNPADIGSVDDLAGTTFVLCDPQVPCGTASQAIIADTGIVAEPASLEHQVADVLGKVVSGEADAGWVYRTDALSAGEGVEVIEIPGSEDQPNEVVAAVTTAGVDKQAATDFVDALTDDEMVDIWTRHGWTQAN